MKKERDCLCVTTLIPICCDAENHNQPPRRNQAEGRQHQTNDSRPMLLPSFTQFREQQSDPQTPQKIRLPQGADSRTPATPSPSKRSNEDPIPQLPSLDFSESSRQSPSETNALLFELNNSITPSTPQRNRKRSFSDEIVEFAVEDDFHDGCDSPSPSASRRTDARGKASREGSPKKSPRRRFDQGATFNTPLSQLQFQESQATSSQQIPETSSSNLKGRGKQIDPYAYLSSVERHIISFISERRAFYDTECPLPGIVYILCCKRRLKYSQNFVRFF